VSVAAEFERPLRFNDPVEVELAVESVGRSSVRYALAITGPEGPAMRGQVTAALIDQGSQLAIPWPDDLRAALEAGGDVSAA
jgi:acyl-CoA thioesterase FadM